MNHITNLHAASPNAGRWVGADALQARLGSRLAGGLTAMTAALPHDVSERLRVAREQAVTRARQVRLAQPVTAAKPASASSITSGSFGGAAALRGGAGLGDGSDGWSGAWSQWAGSLLPLLVLLAGLVCISQWSVREQVMVAAEIDSLLLADDLPPAAYADPGFGEYLRTSPPSLLAR
jgi:hypothetical protein